MKNWGYMSINENPINLSGRELEDDMETFLIKYEYPYSRNSNGIDFIVHTDVHTYYIECKNQNRGGSVVEKLPHTVWKYKMKYDMETLHIIQPYRDYMGRVMEHIEWLKEKLDMQIWIGDFATLCNILLGTNPKNVSKFW